MEMDLHLPKGEGGGGGGGGGGGMSPESDTDDTADTPLLQTRLSKALSLSANHHNGSPLLKPHPHRSSSNPNAPYAAVSYKECLKNHAAKLGGLALDGCGEFMPTPTATPRDPTSLKCAACGCHRNFHRRELPHHLLVWAPPSPSPDSGPNSPTGTTTTTTTSSPTPLDVHSSPLYATFPPPLQDPAQHGAKRARTKFTPEQKSKMQAFAEKLGWRMARGAGEERMVEEFCNEVGVRRNVFKVWMHNNKHRKEINKAGALNANATSASTITTTTTSDLFHNSVVDVNLSSSSSKISDEEQLPPGGYHVVERKVFGSSSPPS